MTDEEMYKLLLAKSNNIKLHLDPKDVADIAKRFGELAGIKNIRDGTINGFKEWCLNHKCESGNNSGTV